MRYPKMIGFILGICNNFMPRLNQSSFPGKMSERIGYLCFVGVSCAVKWVYMSGNKQSLIAPMQELGQETTRRYVETSLSSQANGLFNTTPAVSNPDPLGDDFGLD